MANEHEDGIDRWWHQGRVHRWSRDGSAWPGHTTFVAIRGGEVVVGDRYAGEGIERTYACHPQALLDGCFAALVAEQLGGRVLEELVAEVQRELGVGSRVAEAAKRPETAAEPASPSIVEEAAPSKVVFAPAQAVRAASVAAAADRVDVAVVACATVSLPLAAALRGVTRAPVKELLARLRQLPCTVLVGVSPVDAEHARVRLTELGATVELMPASA